MKPGIIWTLAALSAFALIGCNPPADKGEAKAGEKGTTAPETAKAEPVKLEGALNHDGFAYSGLADSSELTYTVVLAEGGTPTPGTQMSKVGTKDANKAQFTVSRTGALAQLGEETQEVRPDGVWLVKMAPNTLKKETMALPADLSVGKTWKTTMEVEQVGEPVRIESTNKVERTEKITTTGGEFDTLLVTSSATVTMDGKTGTLNTREWRAKGVGTVRLKIEGKDPSGQAVSMSVELAKPEAESKPAQS